MNVVDATLQYMRVSDGNSLYYQKWMPKSPKAIIIFVHGLTGHIGRYGPFTQYFSGRNFGVCLFDLRGHGRSGGRRAHINRFGDYLSDVSQFVSFIKGGSPDAPVFLVGHSFGGQIVLNHVVRDAGGIRGIVALSPNIEPKVELPGWKLRLGTLGAKYLPVLRVNCNVDPHQLSHDQAVVDSYIRDTGVLRSITLRCGYEILRNTELVMAMASRIHLPILMMHGGEDRICSADATKRFYMRVPIYNKQLKIYPGLYHELLNETERERVFQDMEDWFDTQLRSGSAS